MPFSKEEREKVMAVSGSAATGGTGNSENRLLAAHAVLALDDAAKALEETANGQKTASKVMLWSVVIMTASLLLNLWVTLSV